MRLVWPSIASLCNTDATFALAKFASKLNCQKLSVDQPTGVFQNTTMQTDFDASSGPPFALRRLDHIVLRVRDLAAMRDFYMNVLGCSEERRQEEIGLYQLRAGDSLIDLVPVDGKLGRAGGAAPGSEGRNLDHLCLRVDPFDPAMLSAWLREHGVDPGKVESRYGAEGEGPSLYVADPEGNVVELKGPPARKDAMDEPILECEGRNAWEAWLAENGERARGVWLRLAKKGAARPTLTYAQALEAALCHGWIDGRKQAKTNATGCSASRRAPRRASGRRSTRTRPRR